jgi:hypothetical protein
MKKILYSITVLLMIAAFASAEGQAQEKETKDKNALNVSALAALVGQQCFTSGTGGTFLKICITDNGNISWIESPAGYVHLQNREGYAVCSGGVPGNGATVHGFDANIAAAGWGSPTASQPNGAGTLPLIITRKSMDGVIQLKQTFTLNAPEREVNVKMDVKNTSAGILDSVYLSRYYDGDIDGQITNLYDRNQEAVWARGQYNNTAHGLMLNAAPAANISFRASGTEYMYWDPYGSGPQYARGCDWDNAYSPATGDFVGILQVDLTPPTAALLNPGQTKTVTIHYRRF